MWASFCALQAPWFHLALKWAFWALYFSTPEGLRLSLKQIHSFKHLLRACYVYQAPVSLLKCKDDISTGTWDP